MGYYGLSTDGETSDENLADFAEDAIVDTYTFKQTWFDANEDWHLDDTAAIFTCESSNQSYTLSQYINGYNRTWTRRTNNGTNQMCGYSTHQG